MSAHPWPGRAVAGWPGEGGEADNPGRCRLGRAGSGSVHREPPGHVHRGAVEGGGVGRGAGGGAHPGSGAGAHPGLVVVAGWGRR